jgi:tetratricopeptide (TPR) repeat protein
VQWQASLGRSSTLEGAVTDSGYVAVCADTPTEALTGDVYVFGPAGERLMKKRLPACVNQCGLSGDAAVAWCVTLRNPDAEAASNKLFVFSVKPLARLFTVGQPYGRVEEVWLEGSEVLVSTGEGLCYRYSPKGKLLNEEELVEKEEEARLSAAIREGDGYTLLRVAEGQLEKTPLGEMAPEKRDAARHLLEQASESRISDHTKAKAHRWLGEIALASGQKAKAVAHFRKALELNPKVGVKKRLEALGKDERTP